MGGPKTKKNLLVATTGNLAVHNEGNLEFMPAKHLGHHRCINLKLLKLKIRAFHPNRLFYGVKLLYL